jgi:hypothetical protein
MAAATKFVELLMHSRNQAHAFHLVTDSRAVHKALQGYYEGIVPLVDDWAEAYMGKYGRLKRVNMNAKIIMCPCKIKSYFRNLAATIRKLKLPRDSYLKSIQDQILVLIRSTQYKLSLK